MSGDSSVITGEIDSPTTVSSVTVSVNIYFTMNIISRIDSIVKTHKISVILNVKYKTWTISHQIITI